MCACVRTTASSLPLVQGARFRSRSSFRPWNSPASIKTRLPDAVVRRWREPVTVWAAPRKVSEATAAQWHIGRHVASRSFPRTRGGRRRTGRFEKGDIAGPIAETHPQVDAAVGQLTDIELVMIAWPFPLAGLRVGWRGARRAPEWLADWSFLPSGTEA